MTRPGHRLGADRGLLARYCRRKGQKGFAICGARPANRRSRPSEGSKDQLPWARAAESVDVTAGAFRSGLAWVTVRYRADRGCFPDEPADAKVLAYVSGISRCRSIV